MPSFIQGKARNAAAAGASSRSKTSNRTRAVNRISYPALEFGVGKHSLHTIKVGLRQP